MSGELLEEIVQNSNVDADANYSETNNCDAYIESNTGISQLSLKDINLPPKVPKRGGPKGSQFTVVGLQKKKSKMDNLHLL
uniref:Uncharacterized protein n=1 Tax=Amphimedon queenslandica TaxID=400682 RepID=A0A1X7UTS9_AMPQE